MSPLLRGVKEQQARHLGAQRPAKTPHVPLIDLYVFCNQLDRRDKRDGAGPREDELVEHHFDIVLATAKQRAGEVFHIVQHIQPRNGPRQRQESNTPTTIDLLDLINTELRARPPRLCIA